MPEIIRCACGAGYRVREDAALRAFKCQRCGQVVELSAAAAPEVPDAEEGSQAPAGRRAASDRPARAASGRKTRFSGLARAPKPPAGSFTVPWEAYVGIAWFAADIFIGMGLSESKNPPGAGGANLFAIVALLAMKGAGLVVGIILTAIRGTLSLLVALGFWAAVGPWMFLLALGNFGVALLLFRCHRRGAYSG